MKKNVLWALTGLALVLAFGLVLSGCPNPTGGGFPALSGTITISPNEGVTTGTELTAAYTGYEDVTYQWNKGGTAIDGETDAAYTPVEAESYTVTVSAAGYQSKTSAAVTVTGGTLLALSGDITISPNEGVTTDTALTANYSGDDEPVSYQWNKDGTAIDGETGATYTPTEAGSYTVTVSATGYLSKTSDPVTVTGETLPALSGDITISPNEGVTTDTALTAAYDGDESVTYQWKKDGTAIDGETGATYTPTDAGSYTVTVSAAGYQSKTSAAVTVTDESLPALTGTVNITGIPKVGETLTAGITGHNGTGTIHYQWIQGASTNVGADQNTYVPAAGDVGNTIKVQISYSGNTGSVTSAATAAVAASELPALTGTASITGTAKVGETLTAGITGHNGTGTIHYQWIQGASTNVGADQNTYVPAAGDVGNTIKVQISYSGNTGSVTSAATAAVAAADLPALTGKPTISGTAKVGETLTAGNGTLSGTGTATYQWKAGGTNAGTNQNTYVPVVGDVGKTITVTVSYSGNSGNQTSDPTAAVVAADLPALTGKPTISGTPKVGQTLTANQGTLNGTGTPSYQWKAGGTNAGTNQNTYVPVVGDVGKTITVTVSYSGNSGSQTSDPTAAVADPDLTGKPTISGTPKVGETLTANQGTLNGTGTPSYQWKAGGTNAGTNQNTYVPVVGDVGKTITVTVSYSGNSGSQTSDPTAAVAGPDLTGKPTISGTPKVGETLTANPGTLNGTGTATYQWKAGGTNAGTNQNTYVPVAGDVGKTITVTVSYSGNSGSQTSDPTATVASVTKTALQAALTAAATAKDGTANSLYWVKTDDLTIFETAITAAQTANTNANASQTAVDTAEGTLATATGTFTTTHKKNVGETNPVTALTAIKTARTGGLTDEVTIIVSGTINWASGGTANGWLDISGSGP